MAITKSSILAVGTTTATSSSVTVDAGASVGIGLCATSGALPDGVAADIFVVPVTGDNIPYSDNDKPVRLTRKLPYVVINGPIEIVVKRPAGPSVGIFKAV